MTSNHHLHVGTLVLLLFVSGCGDNVTVTGKVTFEDGKPLTAGRVCFQTDKFLADGPLKADGTYTLGGEKENSGVPPGKYQVYITGATTSPQLLQAAPGKTGVFSPPVSLIHQKFTDKDTSGLTCEVKGRTVFDISVTPP